MASDIGHLTSTPACITQRSYRKIKRLEFDYILLPASAMPYKDYNAFIIKLDSRSHGLALRTTVSKRRFHLYNHIPRIASSGQAWYSCGNLPPSDIEADIKFQYEIAVRSWSTMKLVQECCSNRESSKLALVGIRLANIRGRWVQLYLPITAIVSRSNNIKVRQNAYTPQISRLQAAKNISFKSDAVISTSSREPAMVAPTATPAPAIPVARIPPTAAPPIAAL